MKTRTRTGQCSVHGGLTEGRTMGAAGLICSAVSQNVPFMGKTWCLSMLLPRLLLVLLAGSTLYSDDQARFVCDTIQPGCSTVCFDAFAPVSVHRLWLLHCLLLGLPHALFAAYVAHEVLSHTGAAPQASAPASRGRGPPRFHGTYSLSVVLRMVLEACCGAGQCVVFGLSVPKSFLCHEAPCVSGVQCYVSKPTEKTLMLHLMLGVSSLSVLLSLLDLLSSVRAMLRWRRQAVLVEEMKAERSSVFTTTGGAEDGGLSSRRSRPSGGSAGADRDAERPGPKGIQPDEAAASPASPLRGAASHPRGPTQAATHVALLHPDAEDPGQQDRRAWV